jgi:hypothetical protein
MPEAGWIRMYHPDQSEEPPDPDDPEDADKVATVTRESYDTVWTRRGWVNLDAESPDLGDYPEKATEVISWIDSDPDLAEDRARYAIEQEEAKEGGGFPTVISHAEKVIDQTEE